MATEPTTLQQAIVYFNDPDNCISYLVSRRWKDGVVCPNCGSDRVSYVPSRWVWQCKTRHPKSQFSIKVGTIFEDSSLGLDKWLMAMWMIANCKNGISSHEIARAADVTQKSAWFMLHRIRLAMKQEPDTQIGQGIKNAVEVDETFVGGKPKNKHVNMRRQTERKTIVMGMLTRDTREVRAKVVPDVKRETLQKEILKHVGFGTHVYTDLWVGYDNLDKSRFVHSTVNHVNEYVNGKVHTNGIENFWSLLKRGLAGTYVAVEPFHFDAYVDEQVFRYNTRRTDNDANRFSKIVSQIVGKRLTYAELTGKSGQESPRPF